MNTLLDIKAFLFNKKSKLIRKEKHGTQEDKTSYWGRDTEHYLNFLF